jgi:hypothetical protein
MPILNKSLWLLVLLVVVVVLVACQPENSSTAAVPEAADVVLEQPTVVATGDITEADNQDSEVIIAAATHTVRDVARTGNETPTPHASAAEAKSLADLLPNLGQAPELTNEEWLNSEPLRMSDLRGKVVLIEFWTFG